jgi:hypothetical protein
MQSFQSTEKSVWQTSAPIRDKNVHLPRNRRLSQPGKEHLRKKPATPHLVTEQDQAKSQVQVSPLYTQRNTGVLGRVIKQERKQKAYRLKTEKPSVSNVQAAGLHMCKVSRRP